MMLPYLAGLGGLVLIVAWFGYWFREPGSSPPPPVEPPEGVTWYDSDGSGPVVSEALFPGNPWQFFVVKSPKPADWRPEFWVVALDDPEPYSKDVALYSDYAAKRWFEGSLDLIRATYAQRQARKFPSPGGDI